MIRKQILMPKSIVSRLDHIANERGISASEVVRQAIAAFDASSSEAMESSELMDLVAMRLKEAIATTQEAQISVDEALSALGSTKSGKV